MFIKTQLQTLTCHPWRSSKRKKYKNCFLKIGRNALKYGEANNGSKFVINARWPSSWVCNMLQIKEHNQKLTHYLFQNNIVLYFESYRKRENAANIIFSVFNKLNDWAPQWKKNEFFWLTRWKVMVSKIEREIAAENGIWLTHPSHLNVNKKRIVAQC